MNICPRCGKDLDKIPEYLRDYVHVDRQGLWCVDFGNLSPEAEKCIDEMVSNLIRQMEKTLDSTIQKGYGGA